MEQNESINDFEVDKPIVETKKEKLEELKADFETTSEKKTSKYKLRKIEEQKKIIDEEKANKDFAKFVSGIASMTIDIIISRTKNPIPLSDEEIEKIDGSFSMVIEKYAPLVNKYKEETAFITALGMIILTRSTIIEKFFPVKKNEDANTNK